MKRSSRSHNVANEQMILDVFEEPGSIYGVFGPGLAVALVFRVFSMRVVRCAVETERFRCQEVLFQTSLCRGQICGQFRKQSVQAKAENSGCSAG